jgi:hypothetical protein
VALHRRPRIPIWLAEPSRAGDAQNGDVERRYRPWTDCRSNRDRDTMSAIRRIALWLVWNVRLGRIAPYIMGIALNSRSKEVHDA